MFLPLSTWASSKPTWHRIERRNVALTVHIRFPSVPSQELRSVLGSFGLSGSTALRSMHTLSGGQKSRVALAQLSFSRPHILLLDEPTNHLDLETIEGMLLHAFFCLLGLHSCSHSSFIVVAPDSFCSLGSDIEYFCWRRFAYISRWEINISHLW